MKKDRYMSWDTYFMCIAILSSFRSKDRKTQNGACIVDTDRRIIGIGYNGLPRGLSDDLPELWGDIDDRDIVCSKHTYVVHAEQNAIYNCMTHDMRGATIYATQFPCHICAQAIIQVGLRRVVYYRRKDHHDRINEAVDKMFRHAGVESLHLEVEDVADLGFAVDLEALGRQHY
jgi:dCMP deaminase